MADIEKILSELSLEEKCALCSGVTNWKTTPLRNHGVDSAVMSDGPHGLRKEIVRAGVANVMQTSEEATCFPPAVTLAASWDPEAAYAVAGAIAEEAIDRDVDIVLGPGVNIKRNPLCGRNFEYFSEDPYLAGEMAAAYVKGMQDKNIGASLKHFAVNSQEYRRMTVSSEVDERALREIYLPAFENTVKKSQPYTVMCSYNPINGVHASDNRMLLTDILRKEWGFEGIVVSDWGAVNNRIEGILAGLDLQMPTDNGIGDAEICRAVKEGRITEEDLNKVVRRILTVIFRCFEDRQIHGKKKADFKKNFALAVSVAAKGAVLLKNDGILPLNKGEKITVIGTLAKEMRYQGSGSSRINPHEVVGFTDYLDGQNLPYEYAEGYSIADDKPNKNLIEKAVAVARGKDNVLLFLGLTDMYESEGFDRRHLELPEAQKELVEKLLAENKNIVVVLSGGSPVAMPWINDVRAVLNMYLAGCGGGIAAYKLLFGDANPSGKLAETYPLALDDNPAYKYFRQGPQTVEYRESIFVGYRYFDAAEKEVLFPFGHGLSYTKFEYGDLKLSADKIEDKDFLTVSFRVTNTGDRDGAEVAQLYVRDVESSVYREYKALKGFKKVFLKKGERAEIELRLDKRSFAFYNTETKDWTVEPGEFEILIGSSSRDIRLSAKVTVTAEKVTTPSLRDAAPAYFNLKSGTDFPAEDFEAVLGRPLRENFKLKKGDIDYNSTMDDIGVCWIGKLLRWAVYTFAAVVLPKGSPESMKSMAREGALSLPMRNAYAMTEGAVPKKTVDGLLERCNGGPFRGTGKIISGFFRKRQYKRDKFPPLE